MIEVKKYGLEILQEYGINLAVSMMALMPYSALADEAETCMTEALYFEARSEGPVGMLAVANVILQRVRSPSFPDDVCAVVHQGIMTSRGMLRNACQFSYFCDGKKEKMVDSRSEEEALYISRLARDGAVVAAIEGSIHYHAWYVNPSWSNYKGRVGNHLFYGEQR